MIEEAEIPVINDATPAHTDPFWISRGRSLAAYANVEHTLSRLFADFAGIKPDVANIIFFQISNTHTTGKLLGLLLEKKHSNVYDTFWKSLKQLIQDTTTTRNQIVHWTPVTQRKAFSGIELVPPGYWTSQSNKLLNVTDIENFIEKCDFLSRLCAMFYTYLQQPETQAGQVPSGIWRTWQSIFSQKATYPPATDHPLNQNKSL